MRKNRRDPGIWKKNYRRTWERQGKKRERERERKLVSFRIFKCKVDMESLNPAYTYYILRILCSFVQLYNGWKLSIWSVHGTAADWNLPLTNSCISHERHHCTVLGPTNGQTEISYEKGSSFGVFYNLHVNHEVVNSKLLATHGICNTYYVLYPRTTVPGSWSKILGVRKFCENVCVPHEVHVLPKQTKLTQREKCTIHECLCWIKWYNCIFNWRWLPYMKQEKNEFCPRP